MSTDPSQSSSSPSPADLPAGAPADAGEGARKGPLAMRRPIGSPPPATGQRRHFTSSSGASPLSTGAKKPDAGPPPRPTAPQSSPPPSPPPSAPPSAPSASVPPAELADSSDVPEEPPAEPLEPVAASAPEVPLSPPGATGALGQTAGVPGDSRPRKGRGLGKVDPTTAELRVPPPPKPNRREKLSAELEAELDAALGGQSLEQVMGGSAAITSASRELTELDSRRSATVVRVHGDNVFFALGGRNEGVTTVRSFTTPPTPGQSFDVIVKGLNSEDGLYELHIPGASIEVGDWSDLNEGSIVEAKVTAANTGGLECTVNAIRGFIPASQIAVYRVENTAEFVGQKFLCVVTEANPQRRNLVLSRRAVLEREKEDAKRKFHEELQVGQIHEGVVRKIEDFGAFVDMGGADGLIHVSQMSWERVKNPRDVLKEGQKVQVRVEKFDPQSGKIGLSLRSLQENPWTDIDSRFPIGSTVRGTVSRLANFGAFVKLAPGVEGLIHISELSNVRVSQVNKVVQEGQDVEVKILSVDRENQRIGLSLKAAQAAAAPAAESVEEPEEPLRKSVVKKRSGPLKGGVDRPTGAEGLGLKW